MIEAFQHLRKQRFMADCLKQCHAGTQFQIIRAAHKGDGVIHACFQQCRSDLTQTRSQQRMRQIVPCLIRSRDAIKHRHITVSQPFQLREHKPDPMSPLAARADLIERLSIAVLLGTDKTFQLIHAQNEAISVKTKASPSSIIR